MQPARRLLLQPLLLRAGLVEVVPQAAGALFEHAAGSPPGVRAGRRERADVAGACRRCRLSRRRRRCARHGWCRRRYGRRRGRSRSRRRLLTRADGPVARCDAGTATACDTVGSAPAAPAVITAHAGRAVVAAAAAAAIVAATSAVFRKRCILKTEWPLLVRVGTAAKVQARVAASNASRVAVAVHAVAAGLLGLDLVQHRLHARRWRACV
eukprot:148444-Chlamydomonas_euryale.AAC.1